MIELNETATYTTSLVPFGLGAFAVSVAEQRQMLTQFLVDTKEREEASLEFERRTGERPPVTRPDVSLEYRKVTKTKPRVAGRDFGGRPGVSVTTHEGPVVVLKRNKAGRVYFTLVDNNRDGKFTALRLEGIQTFSFANATAQKEALAKAREALGVTVTAGVVSV